MRFLRREGGAIVLTQDLREPPGSYAILSHTWLPNHQEVLLNELATGQSKPGYKKIQFLVDQAEKDGYEYSWADTCCIDKHNAVELQEALNCMFKWYADAGVCYVLLTDVPELSLANSRWFTRGWTLQELAAARRIHFYDSMHRKIGDKSTLQQDLLHITGLGGSYENASIPQRYRWSLSRQTTRPEDKAYCMLGLMEVRMAPDYGEGEDAARERLFDAVETEHGKRVGKELRLLALRHHEDAAKDLIPSKNEFKKLLDTLAFKDMFHRHEDIADPYPHTCAWLLQHDSYQRWAAHEFPFLWLKGKPGAGKSTMVKHIMASHRNAIFFFFHARGTELQKTVIGMYRCMMYQLLKHCPRLQDCLLDKTEYSAKEWTVKRLQTRLKQAILGLQERVTFFIDALDECDTEDVQDMAYLFVDLALLSDNFSICFASRYYPGVLIKGSIEIRLDEQTQHDHDIRTFVIGRLVVEPAVQERVIDKANGVFIWVVLVVSMLNREVSRGNVAALPRMVDQIPPSIEELLKGLMCNADKELILALQLIEFVQYGLLLEMFYVAMAVGLDNYAAIQEPVSEEHQEAYLHDCTRGLAEVSHSGTVQFIHESVRDLLFKHDSPWMLETGYSYSQVHDRIKWILFSFLRWEATHHGHYTETLWMMRWFAEKDCLKHAEAATNIPQEDFFRVFQYWLENERDDFLCPIDYCFAFPCHSILHRIVASMAWSFLDLPEISGVLADVHCLQWVAGNSFADVVPESVFYLLLDRCSDEDKAAWLYGHDGYTIDNRIQRFRNHYTALLQRNIGPSAAQKGPFIANLLKIRHSEDILEAVLQMGIDPDLDANRSDFIGIACDYSNWQHVALLMKYGAERSRAVDFGRTALMRIFDKWNNHERHITLSQLDALCDGALIGDINARDKYGRTALFYACQSGSAEIVNELLALGADLNCTVCSGLRADSWIRDPDADAKRRLFVQYRAAA